VGVGGPTNLKPRKQTIRELRLASESDKKREVEHAAG
jgi:hypothetical protein